MSVQDLIRARKIELVDEDDRPRMRLSCSSSGSAIQLLDAHGFPTSYIEVIEGGMLVSLCDDRLQVKLPHHQGKARPSADEFALLINDRRGGKRIEVRLQEGDETGGGETAEIVVWDDTGLVGDGHLPICFHAR